MIPHLAHEQDAALSIYTAGERYVSSSPHAAIVRDLMRASVLDGEDASATNTPLSTAGAAEAESDSPEHVAAVSLPVVTSERDPSYRDGVQHVVYSDLDEELYQEHVTHRIAQLAAAREAEKVRRSRLSRWQEQR